MTDCPPDSLEVVDCRALARDVANTARSEQHHGGRQSRLTDPRLVRRLLEVYAVTRSNLAAARVAGVSEAIVRRWRGRAQGCPPRACAVLRDAMARMDEQPRPLLVMRPRPDPEPDSLVTVCTIGASDSAPSPLPVSTPDPEPVRMIPPPAPERVLRWHAILEQAGRMAPADPEMAAALRARVHQQYRAAGLTALPSLRCLPASVTVADAERWFLAECAATGRAAPSESHFDAAVREWLGARVLTG